MKTNQVIRNLNVALLSAIAINTATAAEIPITSVTASSTFFTYNVNNLINGSGLSGNVHSGNWSTKWMTNGTVTGLLTFDLGATFGVGSTEIWNYGTGCCGNGRSTRNLSITYSVDGLNYFSAGSFQLSQPQSDPFAGETIGLGFNARYIGFNLLSNYGDNYTGLSEIKFFSGKVVPEPGTLALLGLTFAGLVISRRKKFS